MSAPRRTVAAAGLAVVLVLGAAGCGDDGDDTAATTTVASTSTTPTTPTTPQTTVPGTGETTPPTGTGTTEPPPSTATTVLVPDTSPVSTPPELIALPTDAQRYADQLVQAWAKGNTGYLARLAVPDALAVLAAHADLAVSTWTRPACEGAAGSSYCTYTTADGVTLIVRVGNEAASQGQEHAVTEIRIGP